MEAKGYTFANANGEARECTVLMKELGLKISTQHIVIHPSQLKSVIYSYNTFLLTTAEKEYIFRQLLSINIVDPAIRKTHLRTIENNVYRKNVATQQGKCPKCGGNLIFRNGKYGKFWGCSNYPKCTYTHTNKLSFLTISCFRTFAVWKHLFYPFSCRQAARPIRCAARGRNHSGARTNVGTPHRSSHLCGGQRREPARPTMPPLDGGLPQRGRPTPCQARSAVLPQPLCRQLAYV
ncbi:MAG: topoisomerase DNA-binding C4 zinc finger domain-containing protein [Bacteroidaceae bacterium]|nr:topoisomerase DNA-binding C4 zinc finger domain-containing protein [Bacteroidaceae bacterium]